MRRVSSLVEPRDFAIELQREVVRELRSRRHRQMIRAATPLIVALATLIVAVALVVLDVTDAVSLLPRPY